MKKLFRLLVVLLILAGVGYGWFRQSVHFALMELGRAGREGDVATVEEHLDLAAFVEASAKFAAAVAKAEGKRLGGDLMGELLGGLTSLLTSQIGEAVKPDAVQELRREIARGNAFRKLGPFEPDEGYRVVRDVSTAGEKSRVTLGGTCYGEDATFVVLFERVPGPFGLAWLGTWKATGVDEPSLVELAETCRVGAEKQRGS